jgi:phage repressor protein C with HTH and peptisase S24 domain
MSDIRHNQIKVGQSNDGRSKDRDDIGSDRMKETLDAPRMAVATALQQAGITLKEASRTLGRNDAYLQQYLYRGSPRRLPEDMRYALAALVGCDQRRFLGPDEIERQTNASLWTPAKAGATVGATLGATSGAMTYETTRGQGVTVMAAPPVPEYPTPNNNERPGSNEGNAAANLASNATIAFMDITASAGGDALKDGAAGDEAGSDDSFAMPVEMLRKITPTVSAGLRLITISGDSMAPVLEHGDVVMVDCTQTQPSPPGIFIVDDGVGLVAKRLDLVPATQPQILRLTSENGVYTNYQRRIDEVQIVGRVVWFARTL